MTTNEGQDVGKTEATAAEETTTAQNVSIDDFNALKDQLEHIKKSQTGVDKKNSELLTQIRELQAEKEELEKGQLSKSELASYEAQKKEKEMNALKQEIEALREESRQEKLRVFKLEKLNQLELAPDLADVLDARDEEEFTMKAEKLKIHFDTVGETELKKRMGQSTPSAGKEESGMTQDKFDKLSFVEQNNYIRQNPEGKKYLKFT